MSFEANKIVGAILLSMIVAMVAGLLSAGLVHPNRLEKPAYMVAVVEQPAQAASTAPAGPDPIGPALAQANAAAGKDLASKQCSACHTFDKGGPVRIGPNLYGVFGEQIAHRDYGPGFSDGLKSKQGTWDADSLNQWLWKPGSFAPGTKMTFAGLPKTKDRADVIAYLNSLSDSPKPLAAQ